MRGLRYQLRQITATAVKEHIRSQIEDAAGSPELTKNEIELVRFVLDGRFDWNRYLADHSSTG
jgi:hypothetical protein